MKIYMTSSSFSVSLTHSRTSSLLIVSIYSYCTLVPACFSFHYLFPPLLSWSIHVFIGISILSSTPSQFRLTNLFHSVLVQCHYVSVSTKLFILNLIQYYLLFKICPKVFISSSFYFSYPSYPS